MNDTHDIDDIPSKSQRKREMTALQDLGEALVALSQEQIETLDLPEVLRAAVLDAKRIHKFGALRRQFQYIGKIMRKVDAEPIRYQLDVIEGHSRSHSAWLHGLERWRDRMLADDANIAQFAVEHPRTDERRLRLLVQAVHEERAHARPPRAFRELFRVLRDSVPAPSSATAPQDQEQAP